MRIERVNTYKVHSEFSEMFIVIINNILVTRKEEGRGEKNSKRGREKSGQS